MDKKRVLLIEDNSYHMNETEKIFNNLDKFYDLKKEYFEFMAQNGDTRDSQKQKIKDYILNEIKNDTFDILMIDLILTTESLDNPLGLEIIKELNSNLQGKSIVAYTEMSGEGLDPVKEYGKEGAIHIVNKPNRFDMIDEVKCDAAKRRLRNEKHKSCRRKKERCDSKAYLQCCLIALYYELEDSN